MFFYLNSAAFQIIFDLSNTFSCDGIQKGVVFMRYYFPNTISLSENILRNCIYLFKF